MPIPYALLLKEAKQKHALKSIPHAILPLQWGGGTPRHFWWRDATGFPNPENVRPKLNDPQPIPPGAGHTYRAKIREYPTPIFMVIVQCRTHLNERS